MSPETASREAADRATVVARREEARADLLGELAHLDAVRAHALRAQLAERLVSAQRREAAARARLARLHAELGGLPPLPARLAPAAAGGAALGAIMAALIGRTQR